MNDFIRIRAWQFFLLVWLNSILLGRITDSYWKSQYAIERTVLAVLVGAGLAWFLILLDKEYERQ